ncbi:unnamed protein product [Lymnaea stagnalis]|uniref:Uncharacterized protein n=1 Tax=Lymnaea stagnalis TaxID=6523 RepID=A0AAV2H9R6_LYMST
MVAAKELTIESEKVELKRELGLVGASSVVIGTIIGSGIFISPKGVLENTGSVALSLIVWFISGVIALGGAMCYAELATTIRKSGGAYTYIQMGLGNFMAFVYAIQTIFIVIPGVVIITLLTFAKYLVSMLPLCGSPAYLEKFIVALVTVSIIIVNCYSTRLTARFTILTTFGKLSALVAIIIGGIIALSQGTTSELGTGFEGTSNDPSSLALALYSAWWATSGGENLAILVEEVKNPKKTIPRSFILGLVIVIIVYLLANISYLAVLSRAEMLSSEAVAVTFADKALGKLAIIIPVAVMVSTVGAVNNTVFSGSRVTYSAARDGILPDFLNYIQIRQYTPLGAMILTVVMSVILLAPADVETVINYLGFLEAFFSVCVYIAFFRFRFQTMKDVERTIKAPLIIPIFMLLVNLYLFVAPLVISPELEYAYVVAAVLGSSVLLYIPFIHFNLSLPYTDHLVAWFQLLFQVCPPTTLEAE